MPVEYCRSTIISQCTRFERINSLYNGFLKDAANLIDYALFQGWPVYNVDLAVTHWLQKNRKIIVLDMGSYTYSKSSRYVIDISLVM